MIGLDLVGEHSHINVKPKNNDKKCFLRGHFSMNLSIVMHCFNHEKHLMSAVHDLHAKLLFYR